MTAPESKEARLAAALAEYEKVIGPEWAEIEKVVGPARAEYQRKRHAIEAEP